MGKAARWFKSVFGAKKSRERLRNDSGEDVLDKNVTTVTASVAKRVDSVVGLTGEGRAGDVVVTRKERWAAVTIQKVFRGSLARKALRALKGIVKLQALVRGFLLRKRTAAVLESIQTLIRVQNAMRSKRINRSLSKEHIKTFQPRLSIEKFDVATDDERSPKVVEMDDVHKRSMPRLKFRQVHNVVAMSENEDDLVYHGNDLELEKRKFATAQNTPRFLFSAHHLAGNNRYYVTESSADSVAMSTPGYMENTQSFKAKVRSHSAPRQRPERKRLSLDEVMASRSSDTSISFMQLQPQRYSCS